jgi:hypothetical protein
MLAAFTLMLRSLFVPQRVPVRLVVRSEGAHCRRCSKGDCANPHHFAVVRTDTGEDISHIVSTSHNPLPWSPGPRDLVTFAQPLRLDPTRNRVLMRTMSVEVIA